MRGSDEDMAAFRFMDTFEDVSRVRNDQEFMELYLRTTLKMAGAISIDAQLQVVESDSWKKCEDRLEKLAAKERKKVKESAYKRMYGGSDLLEPVVKVTFWQRIWNWINS